jgi:hypothetical protein
VINDPAAVEKSDPGLFWASAFSVDHGYPQEKETPGTFLSRFRGMMNTPQLAPLSPWRANEKSGACCAVLGGCDL